MEIKEEIIKIGIAFYDNSVEYIVRILKTNFKPGSGDHEDPPEIRDDQYGTFYEIQYAPPNENNFRAGGGYHDTLERAMMNAHKITGGIRWDD
jgi:hypothetical protein